MPKVPANDSAAPAPIPIPPDQEVYFAMAAAQMHKEGRLFEPEPELSPSKKMKNFIEDSRDKKPTRESPLPDNVG